MNDISTTFKEEYVYLDVDKLEMDDFFQQDVEVALDDFILQENDNLTEIQEEVEVQVDTEKHSFELNKNREHNSYNEKSEDTTDDRLSFFFTLILILCMFMLIPLLMMRAKEATRDLTDTLEELSQPKIEMNID